MQVLSQFDFPEFTSKEQLDLPTENSTPNCKHGSDVQNAQQRQLKTNRDNYEQIKTNHLNHEFPSSEKSIIISSNNVTFNKSPNDFPTPDVSSLKHSKRKLLNSHFDTKSKRKFPGPAGLLIGTLEESTDDNIGQLELLSQVTIYKLAVYLESFWYEIIRDAPILPVLKELSLMYVKHTKWHLFFITLFNYNFQDIDFSENHLRRDIFETPLWLRLLEDMRTYGFGDVDSLKAIKQQALTGNLRKRKARTIMVFVEAVDRSATDPLVILRDASGMRNLFLKLPISYNYLTIS